MQRRRPSNLVPGSSWRTSPGTRSGPASLQKASQTSSSRSILVWSWLSEVRNDSCPALIIVKSKTVMAWRRKGFRLFWTWKVRHRRPGRPDLTQEVRDLIRRMSRENPLWGSTRIHGELVKLHVDINETNSPNYISPTSSKCCATYHLYKERRPNQCGQIHGR